MALPSNNGIFIHEGLNCSPVVVPTAQSIPMSPSDSTTVKTAVDTTLSNIANEYDPTSTYVVGDCVLYQKVLYQCTTAIPTAESWDSAHWTAVKAVDVGSGGGGSSSADQVSYNNTTSGLSATNVQSAIDEIVNTKPRVFTRNDVILNVDGGTLRGWGSAVIYMQNGIVRIDFNVKIGVDETVSNIDNWGINRDYFTALTGKTIQPLAGGVVTYYNNEQIYANRVDFGGTFLVSNQFWKPARVYDDNGTKKVGGWVSSNFASGQRFIGTCYGSYT